MCKQNCDPFKCNPLGVRCDSNEMLSVEPIRVTTYHAELDKDVEGFLNEVHVEDMPVADKVRITLDKHGLSEVKEFDENGKEVTTKRTFASGSVRDNDVDKPLVNHLDPYLRLRFGYLLRAGANKYDKGNWKLGQDTETALESLHRHLAKYELNLNAGVEQDEDHLSALVFNIMLILKNEEKAGIPVDHYFGTTK